MMVYCSLSGMSSCMLWSVTITAAAATAYSSQPICFNLLLSTLYMLFITETEPMFIVPPAVVISSVSSFVESWEASLTKVMQTFLHLGSDMCKASKTVQKIWLLITRSAIMCSIQILGLFSCSFISLILFFEGECLLTHVHMQIKSSRALEP